jgi:hypothetical protein
MAFGNKMKENDDEITVKAFVELCYRLGAIPLLLLCRLDSIELLKWYLSIPREKNELCYLFTGYLMYDCTTCIDYLNQTCLNN